MDLGSASSFAPIFGLIFVAELPDKTALAALVLASKHKAAPVFLGTSAALVLQSLIAVFAGSLLGHLPARPVQIGAALLFLVSAIVMWRRKDDDDGDDKDSKPAADTFWRALAQVFGVVFIAEWGDLTQLSTAALAAKLRAPLLVFTASASALICVAALAVFVGNRAGKLLKPEITQKVAAVIFAAVGVAMLLGWPKA